MKDINVMIGQQVPESGGYIILNGEKIKLDRLKWKKQDNIEYVVYKQGEVYLFWKYLMKKG